MQEIGQLLKQNSDVRVELRGHTDNTGNAENNKALSKARAEAVLNFLINEGIDVSRLSSQGYGDTIPVESNDSAEGRETNRRTELRII